MKKIAIWTQTYQKDPAYATNPDGKDREFLIDYQLKDNVGVWLRNYVDMHTFTFHNYDITEAKRIGDKIKNKIPQTKMFVYNKMTYAETFYKHLTWLKSQGITDLLWIQDDEFTTNTNIDFYKSFIKYYKEHEDIYNCTLIATKHEINFKTNTTNDDIGIRIQPSLFLFKTCCHDYVRYDGYAFTMGTCICKIDILLGFVELVKNQLTNIKDTYTFESLLCSYGNQNNFQRCILNVQLFKPYNIVGIPSSLNDAAIDSESLKIRFE